MTKISWKTLKYTPHILVLIVLLLHLSYDNVQRVWQSIVFMSVITVPICCIFTHNRHYMHLINGLIRSDELLIQNIANPALRCGGQLQSLALCTYIPWYQVPGTSSCLFSFF